MVSFDKIISFLQTIFMLLINFCCISAFLVQIFLITYGYVLPDQTFTDTYRQHLHEMEFPAIFKICVVPGFNDSKLRSEGYDGASSYFDGKSRFNKSHFGWGGHYEDVKIERSSKGNFF